MTRLLAALMAVAFAAMLSERSVQTYYDDTHYSLTYYMARVCGYTPLQTYRLASANVSIDYSKLTEPLQGFYPFAASQQPRVAFHAFRDATRYSGGEKNQADNAIRDQRARLLDLAKQIRNPGVLFHFLQDQVSHSGYSSVLGHWAEPGIAADRVSTGPGPNAVVRGAIIDLSLAESHLLNGGTTDWLAYRTDQTNRMVDDSLAALRDFMSQMSRDQRPSMTGSLCSRRDIEGVLLKLLQANPTPPTIDQYKANIGDAVKKKLDLTWEEFITQRGTPDIAPANAVVRQALAARQDLQPYRDNRITYDYDSAGRPYSPDLVSVLDSFTLYGSLQIRLQRATATADPVAVSVWAAPTRASERPYQLTCRSVVGTPARSGPIAPDVQIDDLPVGDLIVRAVSRDGTITQAPILLDRLEQPMVIDLPADDDVSRTCGRKAATLAQHLCGSSNRESTISFSDLQRGEANFEQELGAERSCRATRLTNEARSAPPAASSPRRGGAGKAILGVAGAAAAGIGTWLVLQEVVPEVDGYTTTTSTSSPTTTTTTTTTTTPPTTTSCSHLGSSGGCGVQLQIDAQAYAQTLTSAKRFNVYSVPRGANASACQLQRTICFGIGCPGSGVREVGASLGGLGNLTDATVTIAPIDGGTPGPKSWNVNLTQCAQIVRYP